MFFNNKTLNELLVLFNRGCWKLNLINVVYDENDYYNLDFWNSCDQTKVLNYLISITIKNKNSDLLLDKNTIAREFKNKRSMSPLLDNLNNYNLNENHFVAINENVVLCESGNFEFILKEKKDYNIIVFDNNNKSDLNLLNNLTNGKHFSKLFLFDNDVLYDASLSFNDYYNKLNELLNILQSDNNIDFSQNFVDFNNIKINILDLIKYTIICIKSLSLIEQRFINFVGFTYEIKFLYNDDLYDKDLYKSKLISEIIKASFIIDSNL